jgi:hypothetical protein
LRKSLSRGTHNADRQGLEQSVVALERRCVAVAVPVGLEDNLRDFAIVGPAGGYALGAPRAAAMQQHHVGVLGADLVERVPDPRVIVAVHAAGEGDARAGGGEDLGVGASAGGEKFPAVDHRGGEGAVIDHGSGARALRRCRS